MKLRTDDEVILGSNSNTQKFTIASSSKAFKILSSNLYKNKIRAIVRELSCNCVDAHKMVNSTENFEIKVPSSLDPRFVIRDFGPGMSDDDVTNLYTTYFASTKSNSNDFIGALGLGSKSPFSYTDTFTVVSYHDGMARGYTAMLDKGEPILRPIFAEPMTAEDRNGLEITVPVKPADITTWAYEIKYVLRPFIEIGCTLKGSSIVVETFPEGEYFSSNRSDYEASGAYAIMGNIVYPLREVKGLRLDWLRSKHNVVYIRFPLGELDITPSREELSLDEETVQNIISRCETLDARSKREDLAYLKEFTDPRALLRELDTYNYNAKSMIRTSGLTIDGRSIGQIMDDLDPDATLLGGTAYNLSDVEIKALKIKTGGYARKRQTTIHNLYGYSVIKPVLIIDDKNSRRLRTLRGMQKAGLTGLVSVFKENIPSEMATLERIKAFLGEGNYTVRRITDADMVAMHDSFVPVKKEVTETRPTSPNVCHYQYCETNGWICQNMQMTASEIYDLEGYAVTQKRDEWMRLDGTEDVDLAHYEVKDLALRCGIKEFYAVRPAARQKAVKNENLECLINAFEEKYVELIDQVDYDQYIGDIGSTRFMNRISDQKHGLQYVMSHFVQRQGRTKEYYDLRAFALAFNTVSKSIECNSTICTRIYTELQRQANHEAGKLVDEFKSKHPCVYYTVNNSWDLTQEMIDDVKRQVKAK